MTPIAPVPAPTLVSRPVETVLVPGPDYRSGEVVTVKRPWWKRLRCALGVHGKDRVAVGIPHYGWGVTCLECGRDWVNAD